MYCSAECNELTGMSVDKWLPTALGTVLRAASWAAAHHERRALFSHADAEAVRRGLGSPRPRVADAAAALCGTPRGSCHKSIDACMVRCRCMGFSMVRCQGQSGGTYELVVSIACKMLPIAVPL
jgi:hypothetical protein